MIVCKNYMRIAYTVTGHKQALVTRLRCKKWSCEFCSEKNAKAWQYWLIKRLPEVSERWWLLTLTANENTRTTLKSLENLRTNIDALVKRLKRVFGTGIEYVRVYEKHPSSEAIHVHMIMSGLENYVERRVAKNGVEHFKPIATRKGKKGVWRLRTWMKKNARALGMGYQAEIEEFVGDVSRASMYVTKYLTKEQQNIDIPYLRHVQVTKGIGSPQFEKSYEWIPVSYITSRTFDEPNTRVIDIDTGEVIDNNYWEIKSFWPDEKDLI